MIELDPATTAIVVIDMQNDFCDPEGYYGRMGDVSGLAAAVAPVSSLVARARGTGAAIVYTRLVHDRVNGAMEERHAIRPARFKARGERLVPGTWGAEIVEPLAGQPGDLIIDKPGYSAFEATPLEAELRARGIRTLVLCGVVTYACVLATAFSGFDRGFDILLASDAAGGWNPTLGAGAGEIVDLLMGRALEASAISFRPTNTPS